MQYLLNNFTVFLEGVGIIFILCAKDFPTIMFYFKQCAFPHTINISSHYKKKQLKLHKIWHYESVHSVFILFLTLHPSPISSSLSLMDSSTPSPAVLKYYSQKKKK